MKKTKCKNCGRQIKYNNRKPAYCFNCRGKPTREKLAFKILDRLLPDEDFIENGYYSWLKSPKNKPMQLDKYYPDLALAIEVDGQQHRKFLPHLHKTYDAFLYLQKCDRIKERICKEKGINLIRIRHDVNITHKYLAKRLKKANVEVEEVRNALKEQ